MKERRTYCPDRDPTTTLMDTNQEEQFFKSNPELWEAVTKKLPAYVRPSDDYTWVMSYVQYPLWAFACRSSEEYNLAKAEEKFTLKQEHYHKVHLVITTVLSSFFLIILVIVESIRKSHRTKQLT